VTRVLGTRGSRLALAQAEWVARRLDEPVEIRAIRTAGDGSEAPLAALGDGVFVTAIEQALVRGEIDLAVHSLKDLPTEERRELVIAAIPEREDPRDVLITAGRGGLASLPARARVGTSSPRRTTFIRALVGDVQTVEIRGNVETRMRKVAEGRYDATVLALAGLHRLGIPVDPSEILTLVQCPPAPGQGALAIQCRRDDRELAERLARLDDRPTRLAVTAERALLRELGATCALPLGAHGYLDGPELVLDAMLATSAGPIRTSVRGMDPIALGARAADRLRGSAHA